MLDFKTEYEKCKSYPYRYITEEWAEKVLIHVGKKIYSVLSLMPGSLILPEIPFGSKNIIPNINVFLVGPSGMGKCLKKGSKVLLNNGVYKKIEEVKKGDLVFSMNNTLNLEESKVIGNIYNGKKLCFKVKTLSGRELSITKNHPLFTINGWKKLNELKIGDYIATPRNYHINNIREETSEEKVKILAYLLSDGCITSSVNFTNISDNKLKEFKECVLKSFENIKIMEYNKKETLAKNFKISSEKEISKRGYISIKNNVQKWLESINLLGCDSRSKFVPDFIFDMTENKIAVFLNRLYSCDGNVYISKGGLYAIEYYSNSITLCRDIQRLLLRLDILSNIRTKKIKYRGKDYISYKLIIRDLNNCKKFINRVGIILDKEENCKKILEVNNKSNTNNDIVPKGLWDLIKKEKERLNIPWKKVNQEYKEKINQSYSKNNISREFLSKLNLPIANKFSNSDIYWDKICDITKEGISEVYDLGIEKNHNFVAEDIIVHNSTIADKFESITYFPLKRRDISSSDLKMRAISMGMLSLIIEDFTQFCADYEKVKVAEGILGEEHSIDSSNRREEGGEIDRAIGLIEGTLTDLEKYVPQLEGGLLSRCVFLLISISAKEHGNIGEYISQNTGNEEYSTDLKLKEQVIIEYYQELKRIQEGNHNLLPIVRYKIENRFKEESFKKWKSISEKLINELGEKSYIRDLNYYYKFLVSSAFLNVFNRKTEEIECGRDDEGKVKKGLVLYPNEDDHKLALDLMLKNMRGKWALDKALFYKRNIKTLEKFKELLSLENGFNDVKNILINISPIARALDKLRKEKIN